MANSHPQQWSINNTNHRPSSDLVAQLSTLPTTLSADSGGPVGVIAPGINLVAGKGDFCGTAVTVWTKPGDFLFILKSPDLIRDGDVLVIDGGGCVDVALIGDIVGEAVKASGAIAMVIDGAVRDTDGLEAIGLTTYARGTTPQRASKDGPGAINVAVHCAGVTIEPGDIVRGDSSGIVVVPKAHAAEVLELARAAETRELSWISSVSDGADFTNVFAVDDMITAARNSVAYSLPRVP
jgi:4-hydroxy-4-methyl-2-oxoglutarate aldolase